jgi:hypothetical protein
MIYHCKSCDAWVGVHKGTNKPLGRLANRELRDWKKKAHAAFDPLWQEKLRRRKLERGNGYKKAWARGGLATAGLHESWASIARTATSEFDVEKCQKVVELYRTSCAFSIAQGRQCAYNDNELAEWAGEQLKRQQFAMTALPLVPLGLPLVFFAGLWIWRGFNAHESPRK